MTDPTTFIVAALILLVVAFAAWPVLPRHWPTFKRKPGAPVPPLDIRRTTESTLAREHAERQLAAIRSETPRYLALADELKAKRERNHFAESITRSMQTRGSNP